MTGPSDEWHSASCSSVFWFSNGAYTDKSYDVRYTLEVLLRRHLQLLRNITAISYRAAGTADAKQLCSLTGKLLGDVMLQQ